MVPYTRAVVERRSKPKVTVEAGDKVDAGHVGLAAKVGSQVHTPTPPTVALLGEGHKRWR